jgi:transposase
MRDRVVFRYSVCFKRAVIEALESGRFGSLNEAREHYGIGGLHTLRNWLERYGKNHLLAKVVRVEQPGEADQVRELKHRIAELERALGQTQAQKLLEEEFLKLACRELGQEVETFKKKGGGKSCTPPPVGGS